ncbi:hypothetical protein S101446_03121 [Komagataeibacter europaeus]|nr:hypothetical protein S101446_03121 [Komagataeibacter europaeus]
MRNVAFRLASDLGSRQKGIPIFIPGSANHDAGNLRLCRTCRPEGTCRRHCHRPDFDHQINSCAAIYHKPNSGDWARHFAPRLMAPENLGSRPPKVLLRGLALRTDFLEHRPGLTAPDAGASSVRIPRVSNVPSQDTSIRRVDEILGYANDDPQPDSQNSYLIWPLNHRGVENDGVAEPSAPVISTLSV